MKMGVARFASVHPTRDSEATETNDLNKIELLNTTGSRKLQRPRFDSLARDSSHSRVGSLGAYRLKHHAEPALTIP